MNQTIRRCQRATGARYLVAVAGLLPLLACEPAPRSAATSMLSAVRPELFSAWSWRSIGPVRGGRSLASAGSVSRPLEYYFGTVGGGVWKTTDGGTTWSPVSDKFFHSSSVGSIGICEANPDVVYAGMGEGQLRNTMNAGDGAYATRDGGKTWRHIGLGSSTGQQTVARMRVHPRDCNLVYAAVLGDPYGPNPERGVYRSRDGGRTWRRVLYRNDHTGASDLMLDPSDPRTIYATLWDVVRPPWAAIAGPTSGIFKSTDGGETWVELTHRPGLPTELIGKVGISVSRADRRRVYAVVETEHPGVFRSDNAGATWRRVNSDRALYHRSEYFMRIYADPRNRNRVYLLNRGFYRSDDGGVTFAPLRTPHGDNHDLWIASNDPQRMIESNDGGANVSVNGGRTWTDQDYPTAQMYHVITSNDFPYQVCGAQQDNGSKCLPGDGDGTYWYSAAAGEQGYIAIHPERTTLTYGGSQRSDLVQLDRRTGQARNIEVWPDNNQGATPGELRERFQWTFPIVMSPHDPDEVYVASQHVWRTRDGGRTWQQVSPDLTLADSATLGGDQTPNGINNSQDYYATIFALALSPHDRQTIWAGSDDGLVHVTRDGGGHWVNVTPPDLPKHSRVSLLQVSPHAPGKAYVAAERYKMQDVKPYIFKTEDYGKTWTTIVQGIPANHFVRAVKEDPVRPSLLYGGTEHGFYISFDDGATWQPLSLNLPDVEVSDMETRNADLVISTFGRGFYVLDDIAPLRQLSREILDGPAHLFQATDPVLTRAGVTEDYRRTVVPNRARIYYYLRQPAQEVVIEVLGSNGETVRSYAASTRPGRAAGVTTAAGLHRVVWDLRYTPATAFEPMYIRGGGVEGPLAPPGEYRVRLTVDGQRYQQPLRVRKDPRLPQVTQADLEEQFTLARRIHQRLNDATSAVVRIRALKQQLASRVRQAADRDVRTAGQQLDGRLSRIEGELYQVRLEEEGDGIQRGFGIKLTEKLANLKDDVEGADAKPTRAAYEVFDGLSARLAAQLTSLEEVLGGDLAAFNRLLQERSLAPVEAPATTVGGGER